MSRLIFLDQSYDLTTMCRSCMGQKRNLKYIFDTTSSALSGASSSKSHVVPLHLALFEITNIDVHLEDQLPTQICNNCAFEVRKAFAFKQMCLQSDATLRQYLQLQKPPKLELLDESNDLTTERNHHAQHGEQIFDDTFKSNSEQSGDNSEREDVDEYFINIPEYLGVARADECFDHKTPISVNSNIIDHPGKVVENVLDVIDLLDNKQIESTIIAQINTKISDTTLAVDRPERFTSKMSAIHLLGKANGLKEGVCKLCEKTFDRVSSLRSHIWWHAMHVDSFKDIPISRMASLCGMHDIARTVDEIIKWIQYRLRLGESHRFYQLSNSIGWEMELSDSETDSDEEKASLLPTAFYACDKCGQRFARQHLLVSHMHVEHTVDDFQHLKCGHCAIILPCEQILYTHQRRQCANPNKSVRCEHCGIRFQWQSVCDAHILKMHNKIATSACSTQMPKTAKDQRKPTGKSFECDVCAKRYRRRYHLKRHLKTHAKSNKTYSCEKCKKDFNRKDNLMSHMRLHLPDKHEQEAKEQQERPGKSYECDVCAKEYQRRDHLKRHLKTHAKSNEKYSCEKCKKVFNRKDNLNSHMRLHRPDKLEKEAALCVICGRSFSSGSNLIVHIRRHTGEKPYKCDMCDMAFPRSSDLLCHRRSHTGEKPYLCTICGKGFTRSNKLDRHMRVHTKVRPYKCTYCDRAFTQTNDLTLHIRRHTGEKPYKCDVCDERFIHGSALRAHRKLRSHFEQVKPTKVSSLGVNVTNHAETGNQSVESDK